MSERSQQPARRGDLDIDFSSLTTPDNASPTDHGANAQTLKMPHGLKPHIQRILSRVHTGMDLDRYRIIEPIGVGSNGVVYRALDAYRGDELALKVFNLSAFESGAFGRYREQIIKLKQIDHPGLVVYEDPGHWQGLHFLPMELVWGPENRAMNLLHYGRMFESRVEELSLAKIFVHLLDVLGCLHEHGIVHGCLKPANILFAAKGFELDEFQRWRVQLKVTDTALFQLWGQEGYRREIISAREELDPRKRSAADTLALIESGEFICPHWLEHGGQLNVQTDIYSLGRILVMLLTGQRVPVKPTIQIRPELNPGWDDIIARAIDPVPENRFQNTREMAQAIADLKLP